MVNRVVIAKSSSALPGALAVVSLIDAEVSASTGGMSISWWLEEVRAGRAPQPAVRRPRCTRWRLSDVADFWRRFAEEGAADTQAAEAMRSKLTKASAAAQAKRIGALRAVPQCESGAHL